MINEIQNFFSLTYWRSFFQSPTKKRLTENFFSLSVLQGFNYILPLITLPYLVRVLGPEKFGLVAFAQAFLAYFVIIVAYGFDLSATKEISINRENKKKISEIFSSVMVAKIILALFSFLILAFLLLIVPRFRIFWLFYLLMFEVVIWNILFPVWFFQGMEKMKFITLIAILSRAITVVFIFVLIKKPSDYILYPIVDFIGNLIAGAWAIKIVLKDFRINFQIPRLQDIKHQFQESWHLFASNASANLVSGSNAFILGLFTNNLIVGYYIGAEKIIKAVLGLVSVISNTLFPYVSRKMVESKIKTLIFLKKILLFNIILGIFIFSILFIFSPLIIKIILGKEFIQSIIVLRILALIILLLITNNIAGVQTMIPMGYKKTYLKIILIGGIINILLLIILCPTLHHIGAAISWVTSEIIITFCMFLFLKMKSISY